jgi:hypothetical protein
MFLCRTAHAFQGYGYIPSFITPATRDALCLRLSMLILARERSESHNNPAYCSTRVFALTTRMLSSPCLFWSGRLLGTMTSFRLFHEASFTGKICRDRTKVTPSVQGGVVRLPWYTKYFAWFTLLINALKSRLKMVVACPGVSTAPRWDTIWSKAAVELFVSSSNMMATTKILLALSMQLHRSGRGSYVSSGVQARKRSWIGWEKTYSSLY